MRKLKALQRLVPASGGFNAGNVHKTIRFSKLGCANRPFYHIVVAATKREQHDHCIEQIGSYDPMPNERNEKMVACNFERLGYWIGQGAAISSPVCQLLGICGFFPIHPRTYMIAWRNRKKIAAEVESKENLAAENASKKEEPVKV